MTALRMFIFAAVPVGIMIQATNGRDHAQENGVSSQHFKENITVQSGPLCRSSIGKQHSGYVQVGGSNRYFYVAIEADVHPSKAPTFVYISGGPGDSSIACVMGLNGPCLSDPTGTKQLPNPLLFSYSWTQHANGIWVDAPGPTGFSLGPVESSLEKAVANLMIFLTEFFKIHGHFNRDYHLVGVSASASFVVMLGTQIIKNQELKANFRGVMALSGEIGPSAVYQGCVDMASQRSLVPQDILNKMQSDMKLCQAALADCNSNGPGKPAEKDKCLKAATLCDTGTTFQLEKIHRSICDVRTKAGREYKFYKFNPGDAEKLLNSKSVQEELGVAKIFRRMNYEVFEAFIPYSAYDTTYFVNELLDQGIKVLILNGAEDFVTNYGGTEKWVFSLKGEINYGLKLASSPLRTLQYPGVGVFGKYYRYSFANGAHLAVIKVINSGHYMVLNAPGGMQRAFNSFLSGELWEG